jgi:hypothetical protein
LACAYDDFVAWQEPISATGSIRPMQEEGLMAPDSAVREPVGHG